MCSSVSTGFYRILFEEAPIGLALCRMEDGSYVAVNGAFAAILGRTPEETLKQNYWDITPREDYQKKEEEQLAKLREVGRYGPYRKEYVRKDGSRVAVTLSGVRATVGGADYIWSIVEEGDREWIALQAVPAGTQSGDSMHRDPASSAIAGVRALDQPGGGPTPSRPPTEDFYRILFDEAPVGLALCRMDDGSYVAVNKAFAAILGRDVEDTMTLSYWNITPIQYKDQEEEQLRKLNKEGRYGPYFKEYFHKDGSRVRVTLSGLPVTVGGVDYIWSIVEEGIRGRLVWHRGESAVTICFVLLLKDDEKSETLGPALWAALQEVEVFFNGVGKADAAFQRFYLSKFIPDGLGVGRADPEVERAFDDEPLWKKAMGKYEETYSVKSLVGLARRLSGIQDEDVGMILVTDLELDPEPDFMPHLIRRKKPMGSLRYMIHAMYQNNTHVISLQPLDPMSWAQEDPDRIATIKHRVRAVCCRASGLLLGLEVCATVNCFLQLYMTSPDKLDQMICLCHEHPSARGYGYDLEALADHGFEPHPKPTNPTRVQAVKLVSEFIEKS